MPFRKTHRRRPRTYAKSRRIKRAMRRKGLKPGYSTAVLRRPGFPPRFFTRLSYTDNHSLVTTTPGWYQYRANSLFDPDYTGTGGQPLYFDQLAAIYRDYRVHGVIVELKGMVRTAGVPSLVMHGYSSSTNLPSSIEQASEDRTYSVKVINSEKPFYIKRYLPMHLIAGKAKNVLRADLNYSAGIGASPSNSLYFNVGFSHIDGATSIQTDYILKLTYLCEFNNLYLIGRS